MPLALLSVNQNVRWTETPDWLPPNEVPGDLLRDLRTLGNALSMWEIDDDRGNLSTVITALASGKDHPESFDYVIVPLQRLTDLAKELDFTVERTDGGTRHEQANQYHLDLSPMTGSRLVEIARLLFQHGEPDRMFRREILAMLKQAHQDGKIANLNDSMLRDLGAASPP